MNDNGKRKKVVDYFDDGKKIFEIYYEINGEKDGEMEI